MEQSCRRAQAQSRQGGAKATDPNHAGKPWVPAGSWGTGWVSNRVKDTAVNPPDMSVGSDDGAGGVMHLHGEKGHWPRWGL